MNCQFCGKDIYGMTGLQEIQKYQKHLRKCRKNPCNRNSNDMRVALEMRVESEKLYSPETMN